MGAALAGGSRRFLAVGRWVVTLPQGKHQTSLAPTADVQAAGRGTGTVPSPRSRRAEAAHLGPDQNPFVRKQFDPKLPRRGLDAHAFRDLDLDLSRRDRGAPYDVHRSSRDLDRAV